MHAWPAAALLGDGGPLVLASLSPVPAAREPVAEALAEGSTPP